VKLDDDTLRLAATDLANHLACRHLTTLDRGLAEGRWKPPDWYRPEAEVLKQRGFEHERAYLDYLEQQGRHVTRLDAEGEEGSAFERTVAQMRAGADIIVQATLIAGRWLGRADVLLRVERASDLGAWSYEALDTKLAQETKAGAVLQLCLYSDLLREIQGVLPERMYVVPRKPGFPLEPYRVDDYLAYYRLVRRRLEAAVDAETAAGDGAAPATYPEPVPHCDVCRWWPRCDQQRRADDHLCFVAGISRLQTRELKDHEIATLSRLAQEPLPIAWKPARGAREGYGRVREQARIQSDGRARERILHELLPIEPGRGLALLPAPSPGDVFLDLEADPYVDEGGLEYLFGWVTADAAPEGSLALEVGPPVYGARWALDRAAERSGFEAAVDAIMRQWAADPNMHVYHYGAYEPGALKRLMGRYASREAEIDRLLRGGRIVDLHAIVKQTLRASVEEYSIKNLEPLYGFERTQPLEAARGALRLIERSLELGYAVDPRSDDGRIVEAYNRDDCLSARALREWLERLRAQEIARGAEIPRPGQVPGDPNEKVGERERMARELAERLLAGVPEDRRQRSEEQHARWLLAHMLDWHRREEKAPWWEYFRLRDMSDAELLDDNAALSGLEFVERVGAARVVVDRYRFPAQDTAIREDSDLELPGEGGGKFGKVVAIDLRNRTVDIKKVGKCTDLHPTSVFAHKVVGAEAQAQSLMRLGLWVLEHGVDSPGEHRAARDLLLGRPPRIAGHAGGPLERPGEGGVLAARRLALALDHGTLAIQGPPGSGKTFTGARMILDLVRRGKKVGVCAASHKVVRNLLSGVVDAAEEEERKISCLQKTDDEPAPGIAVSDDNAEVRLALRTNQVRIAGGTAWLWAREEFFEAVDVLFVDEAGQMSLANVLAIAQSAASLVLLGDPRQLEQPVLGSHPEGTAVSALEHVLAGAQTIADDRGLFLEESWRLPPEICAFTSEMFYERRLEARSAPGLQVISGSGCCDGAGLWFVPVEHDANQSASREEVAVVRRLCETLLAGGARWRDRGGASHPLEQDDILVIAPYNAQVADLAAELPRGSRVGTVDKFQGQEAPIVIFSLTTSTQQDAPRGMDFLFDPNRFNVATSRAMCSCIVVGSPALFEPDCQTPKQMKLANAFCRFLEVAREIPRLP
jgi:predicted RecB family nuclease